MRGRRSAIEREAPRVAQPDGEELARRRRRGSRRIVCEPVVVVDAQTRRAARAVLGVAVRVAAAAAVARAGVEQAVGAELQLAAVVVGLPVVRDPDQRARGAGVGDGRGRRSSAELGDRRRSRRARWPCSRRRTGRWSRSRAEGHRQQARSLPVGEHAIGDVEEGVGRVAPSLDQRDRARLLDDEDAREVAGRRGHVDGRGEGADLGERDCRRSRRGRRERERDDGQDGHAVHASMPRRRGGLSVDAAAFSRSARAARRAPARRAGRPSARGRA